MVKARKIIINEIKCPNTKCGKTIRTEKIKGVQCRHCGKRFDL